MTDINTEVERLLKDFWTYSYFEPTAMEDLLTRLLAKSKADDERIGLTKIALEHKTTLLESCEKALLSRNSRIDELNERGKWISVDDRLPSVEEFVLLDGDFLSTPVVGVYTPNRKFKWQVSSGNRELQGWAFDTVTKWQPLPPTEDE